MAIYKLHDGREIVIDPFVISRKEFKQITTNNTAPDAPEDEPIIAKATGLTVAELENMNEADWRGLSLAVVKAVISPDPTLASESTKP
jgi:hypothetical protein